MVVVSDEVDHIIYQRRLPNDCVADPRRAGSRYREELEGVVVEATYNWYWLVDALLADGYHVHLANPAAIRQVRGAEIQW